MYAAFQDESTKENNVCAPFMIFSCDVYELYEFLHCSALDTGKFCSFKATASYSRAKFQTKEGELVVMENNTKLQLTYDNPSVFKAGD